MAVNRIPVEIWKTILETAIAIDVLASPLPYTTTSVIPPATRLAEEQIRTLKLVCRAWKKHLDPLTHVIGSYYVFSLGYMSELMFRNCTVIVIVGELSMPYHLLPETPETRIGVLLSEFCEHVRKGKQEMKVQMLHIDNYYGDEEVDDEDDPLLPVLTIPLADVETLSTLKYLVALSIETPVDSITMSHIGNSLLWLKYLYLILQTNEETELPLIHFQSLESLVLDYMTQETTNEAYFERWTLPSVQSLTLYYPREPDFGVDLGEIFVTPAPPIAHLIPDIGKTVTHLDLSLFPRSFKIDQKFWDLFRVLRSLKMKHGLSEISNGPPADHPFAILQDCIVQEAFGEGKDVLVLEQLQAWTLLCPNLQRLEFALGWDIFVKQPHLVKWLSRSYELMLLSCLKDWLERGIVLVDVKGGVEYNEETLRRVEEIFKTHRIKSE